MSLAGVLDRATDDDHDEGRKTDLTELRIDLPPARFGAGLVPSGVDIVSGGLPCPPFSKAGKQLGHNDERNLFPSAINIIGSPLKPHWPWACDNA
jgi:site-specific DNA-cytosine methylase